MAALIGEFDYEFCHDCRLVPKHFGCPTSGLSDMGQDRCSDLRENPHLKSETGGTAFVHFAEIPANFNDTSLAMRPSGPTTQGRLSAFQFPESRYCQVLPSSNETSEPLVPTAIHALSSASQATAER